MKNDKEIVLTGRKPDEMMEMASKMLSVDKSEIKFEILEEKKGLLTSFIGNRFKIRYYREDSASALLVTRTLLKHMGIEGKVTIEEREGYDYIRIFARQDERVLIGKDGRAINSLEHIIGRISYNGDSQKRGVILDVGDYRRKREKYLEKMARDLASRARSTRREILTEPLLASERRIVHRTLQSGSRVKTYAVGKGTFKKIVISPEAGNGRRR